MNAVTMAHNPVFDQHPPAGLPLVSMDSTANIEILRVTYLRGPNIWTYRPVLEVWLDLGPYEDWPSHLIPGFNERLLGWLPALEEHHCGVGERGGFIERLREGTWAGHVLEHIVIELLNLGGLPTGFGQTRSTSRRGVYRMVFRARDERVARSALKEGHALLMACLREQAFDVAATVDRIRETVDGSYLGPSTACIVAAATDRRIPHIRLNDGNLVQLGYGNRQRRIWTAETERTSAIAEGIARDKDLTKSLLRSCGVPVPEGAVAHNAAHAWEIAQDLGLPVAVKPSDGNHSRGVSLDLRSRVDIEAAFDVAALHGSEVLVERFIPGHEHRLLVVAGKLVAAARGETASVVGDGVSSIRQLIEQQINSDPRRGLDETFPLGPVEVDKDEAVQLELKRQQLDVDAVPEAGRAVLIQRNGNLSVDCTDEVHPEVAHAVGLAAKVVGLDIAGIDLVAQDISRPLQAQGGAIVEVNAGPGLLMHLKPEVGTPRPVGRAIVDHLFAEDESGRIPIVGIAGTQANALLARVAAWLLQLCGHQVGLACGAGLFINQRCAEPGPCATWGHGHRLLMNRSVSAVVVENSARTILEDGLAYDRCAVGVVTDFQGYAELGHHDIHEAEHLYKVLRTQVDVVLPSGAAVLNATDENVLALATLCDGEVILYSDDATLSALQTHRASGGRCVYTHAGAVWLARGANEAALAQVGLKALWAGDRSREQNLAVLAAIAVAWAMDVSPDLIAAGIRTFSGTELAVAVLPRVVASAPSA